MRVELAGNLVAVPGKVYAELARRGGQAEATPAFQIENLGITFEESIAYRRFGAGCAPRCAPFLRARLIVTGSAHSWRGMTQSPCPPGIG